MLQKISNQSRTLIATLLAFVAALAFLSSPLLEGTAEAKGCTKTFSKYSGTECVPETSKQVKKDAATIFFGCMFGAVGANPASIGYGCLAGTTGVVIDHVWG